MKEDFGAGAATAESDLVKAIAAGDVDGGWPATRAFAGAGIDGLQAVEAPMTITSYEAEKAVATGPAAKAVLSGLDGTGIAGLGLSVGPLRRPFAATAPLLAVGDWQGVRFRTFHSPVQAATMTALGATPVDAGVGWADDVRGGSLRGAELDIAQYAHNGESAVAGNVTANVVLWPKMYVLSLSKRRYDALTGKQRGWVRAAAARATPSSTPAPPGCAAGSSGSATPSWRPCPTTAAAARIRAGWSASRTG